MVCKKCGYSDIKESIVYGSPLCKICKPFAPKDIPKFQEYILDKIDWRTIETFRMFSNDNSDSPQKKGMEKAANRGETVNRSPYGYDLVDGILIKNLESSKVFSIFNRFVNSQYSLNFLAGEYNFSVNGLKKILKNRVYLGEIKFAQKLYKGIHEPIIPQDLFYAAQRKLESISKKKIT